MSKEAVFKVVKFVKLVKPINFHSPKTVSNRENRSFSDSFLAADEVLT